MAFPIILAHVATAQPSAILDDLHARALATLHAIPRASSKREAEAQREPLQRKLEASLGFSRMKQSSGSITAFVYSGEARREPGPAILIARPHEDPRNADTQALIASLVHGGFVVIALDLRPFDNKLDLLPHGLAPIGLMQQEIREGLEYLTRRPDVDARHIGLIGSHLAATFATAINPVIAASVIIEGAPDLEQEITQMLELRGGNLPDPCDLVPGILRYGATQELFALIAPRPFLAIRPAQNVFDYASDLYSSYGEGAHAQQASAFGSAREFRDVIYRWFARFLEGPTNVGSFQEPEPSVSPVEVQLPGIAPAGISSRAPMTRNDIESLLGTELPRATVAYGLKIGLEQQLTLQTQPGLRVPATVFRPGSEGRDPERGVLIAVSDAGKETLSNDEVVREAVRRGWIVWAVDPRGLGEAKPDSEGFLFGISLLLGENFVWRQASDIRRILETVTPQCPIAGLYARGPNASVIAAYVGASVQGERPAWIAIRDGIFSFSNSSGLPPHVLPFNALALFDIPDLLAASKRRVIVLNQLDKFLQADW